MADHEERPSKKPRASSPPSSPAPSSVGLTSLALRLSKKLAEGADTRGKNIAFSPLSIYTALGLAAAGARGATLDELLALLGAASREELAEFASSLADGPLAGGRSGKEEGPLVITSAYGVFHQERMELVPEYLQTARESYKAEIRAFDFAKGDKERGKIVEEINEWAASATKNLIPAILPPESLISRTRFVLANAIYFKGVWESRFAQKLTKPHKFHRLGRAAAVSVPFMTLGPGEHKLFMCYSRSGAELFKVLKLPYKGSGGGARYSMCVFLLGKRDGLGRMVDALQAAPALLDHLPTCQTTVGKLLLPKFKLSLLCKLGDVLQSLGVREAFDEDKADFSGLVEKRICDVRLDEVFHKAVVEVNEEGTEASAFTALLGRVKQCAREPENFVADHPFTFYIVEEVSGTVIFAGHVLDPSISEE